LHPYLRGKIAEPGRPVTEGPPPEPYDPISHVYPPLVGPTGREYHGPENEHDRETLERHRSARDGIGARPPGPSRRPERLYLHYLLLHMDRLSDSALRYLRTAVEEEVAHRTPPPPTPPELPATPVTTPETAPPT